MNRDCAIGSVYDTHDIWHFLSAIGLFFYLMVNNNKFYIFTFHFPVHLKVAYRQYIKALSLFSDLVELVVITHFEISPDFSYLRAKGVH